MQFSAVLKTAEFSLARLNALRDAMAEFQSYGVAPSIKQENERAFFQAGTRVELFFAPDDPDLDELSVAMYNFLNAETKEEKYSFNQPYVDVCQKILNKEWMRILAMIRSSPVGLPLS
jgi:hypothetical protein